MPSIVVQMAELLRKAQRPGDFCMRGATELLPPALDVEGVGPVALPLLPHQAKLLVAAAKRAPYGRGPDTIVDTTVRNTWQIGPDQVRIAGRHWPRTLAGILGQVAEGLGLSDPIEAEFYKLLIYDEGSFFVSHRDTEKTKGMFGTLVVVLPSACEGGELVVRHKDRSVQFDLRSDDPSGAVFAAFYADCLHEVRPVTAGCRLTLVYNLIRRGKGQAPLPPNYTSEQHALAGLLTTWRGALSAPADDVPEKLVYPLEHAYTAPELAFAVLKGADAAASGVLAAASEQAACALHLALLTVEEFGSAEYGASYGRRRRWSDGEPAADDFEVDEVQDWTIALSDWRAPSGSPVSWGEIPVTEAELSPPDPFHGLEPDELHFQEASGNAGVSFERRYQRAALVVWPKDRSFAVLTQAGVGVTVPHLLDLAQSWTESGAASDPAAWQQAHDLAGHMIGAWPANGAGGGDGKDSPTTGMLTALARLRDTDRIGGFLTQVAGRGVGYGARDNPAVVAALGLLPFDEAERLTRIIVTANAANSFAACANLLARCSAASWVPQAALLRDAAASLLALMPGNAAVQAAGWSPYGDRVDAGFVADLLTAMVAIDAGLADGAVRKMLQHPKPYDMDAVLAPAARVLLHAPDLAGQPAVARLRANCLAHLRARIALPLAPPADWVRPSKVGCRCPHCSDLSRFLDDPAEKVWIFRATAPDRSHVESTIANAACDVDTATVTRGRPYSLVCTKNQASYGRRAVQRAQDLLTVAALSGG